MSERDPRKRPGNTAHNRVFWILMAAPGIAWLTLLFIVPFYTIGSIAFGQMDVFGNPVAVWDPLRWTGANFGVVASDIAGSGAFLLPVLLRTLVYVAVASALCLLIGYPAAYFVARFSGRRKGLFLILLIGPFWISYMMRMLAWIDLLQSDGYVNKVLLFFHLIGQPVNWLGGDAITVIFGLVYGYVPYLILVLFAGLDRISPSLIEAGRDLGLGRARTFWKVTLPLSRQAIATGLLITVLPMLGDYYTNQLLSATSGTRMIGNEIGDALSTSGRQGQGAVMSLLLLALLVAPMIYYVISTNKSSRTAS